VLDKGDDDIEAAVAREPTLFGLGCSVEQGAAIAHRDDSIALAVKDQGGRLELVDARQRVEGVGHQPGSRHIGKMALGDLGDASRLVRRARNTTSVLQA
jgi:hypothetical protein